ncbi:hypothetical protein ACIRQQ_48325 [Streptomyces fuscichromogenes]|uniref:hypothetical protein n=1 Tax=Streptomyces fuscichromogenes TaxID=1324013 RepID=UPI0038198BBB
MPPQMPAQPTGGPKWARKRFVIPGAALVFFIGIGIGSSGNDQKTTASAKPAPRATVTETAKAEAEPAPTVTVTKTAKAKATPKKATNKTADVAGKVVFKVWGTAPAGALGGLDITYGSDTDNRKGAFRNGKFEATLSLKDDALYFNVSAQLQGSGDINCSVTVEGETKKGHASGGYNICSAQLSGDFLGGWS